MGTETLAEQVRVMVETLRHRGPDASGTFLAEGIALGHTRLSVIDLTPTGAQPMSAGLPEATLTYNGEVYNFRDLRRALESDGCTFRGTSDTEVILQTYLRRGLDGLRGLEGMFALALWDAGRRRLILMRDRFGIKPLFYAWAGSSLLFGSEIKAVLAPGIVPRETSGQAISEYLWYGNTFEDRTIYRNIRALPPGHWLVVENGSARLEAWWRIEDWLIERPTQRTVQEAASAVREALDAAVARQLVSDVPAGLFLSGGVDSSSIAASAARAGRRVSTYSVAFDYDRGPSELPRARRVAGLLGLDHHEVQVTAVDLERVLVDLVEAHDEPFADAANVPLFLLARRLRGALKVVLQGDGGDEMFAGYRRYAILRNIAAWKLWPRRLTPLVARLGGNLGLRVARIADAAGAAEPAIRMGLLLTLETLRDPPTSLLRPDRREDLTREFDPFLAFRRCAQRFRRADPVQQMLLTDLSLQLPSQFLPKVDRATMAHGLEVRVPLIDERVAQLAVGLPSRLKVRGNEKKIVLRDAMRSRLPDDILDAPKRGFGVPYRAWLRGPLRQMAQDSVLSNSFTTRFGIDRQRLEKALDDDRRGTRDRGFLIWKLFQLALWSRHRG